MSFFSEEDLEKAHSHSFKNKEELSKSDKCVCFFCFSVYPASEIELYLTEDDGQKTAVCPYCLCDAVIGDASGIELSDDLIDALSYEYFRGNTREERCKSGNSDVVVLD